MLPVRACWGFYKYLGETSSRSPSVKGSVQGLPSFYYVSNFPNLPNPISYLTKFIFRLSISCWYTAQEFLVENGMAVCNPCSCHILVAPFHLMLLTLLLPGFLSFSLENFGFLIPLQPSRYSTRQGAPLGGCYFVHVTYVTLCPQCLIFVSSARALLSLFNTPKCEESPLYFAVRMVTILLTSLYAVLVAVLARKSRSLTGYGLG